MISLDSEPNPFRSFSYSLTMDGDRGGGRGEDDEASETPSWVHSDDDEQNSTNTQSNTSRHEFKKSSLRSRWLILALTCVVMTGSYYA
jgi:hypothetical protein